MTAERNTPAGQVPVARACELLSVSRSWYYDRQRRRPSSDADLQDEIERLVLEMPGYGYRRVAKQLQRDGRKVNHKRVLRIMHAGLNQVWVADITYIHLPAEFVFLAAILDAFSRKVIGWNLSRRLDVSLTLTALECALTSRRLSPGVIHHSDRGVQYAAGKYVSKAQAAGMLLSMSRPGQPRDNPQAESFFRTLKMEQVYLSEYLDFDDAYRQIGHFIEDVYNCKRLHSALGYRPPVEYEAGLLVTEGEKGRPGRSTVGVPVPEPPLAPALTW